MPTLEQYLYPTSANRPAAHGLYIAQGTHAHKLGRWRELACHNLRNPLGVARVERICKHYPLTAGTYLEPIALTPTHFTKLLWPALRATILPADYPLHGDAPAPFPRWMAVTPQVRRAAITEAATAGYSYLRLLNYVHTAHHKMLFEAHADPSLIQRAAFAAADTSSPHAYLCPRYLPKSFTTLLEPVPI